VSTDHNGSGSDHSAVPPDNVGSGKPPKGDGRKLGSGGSAAAEAMTDDQASKLLGEAVALEYKDWPAAIALYKQVIAGGKYRGDAYLGLSRAYFESLDFQASINAATSALKAGAGDRARRQLGHAYFKKGYYDQALTYYEALLKSHPGDREIQNEINAAKAKIKEREQKSGSGGTH
jgi:tetratricopeptide (TPR) repeat protein